MKNIFKTLIATCLFCACDDFVDVVPKGNTIPQTVDDLAMMMNNGSFAMGNNTTELWGVATGTLYLTGYSDDYILSENPESGLYGIYNASTNIANSMTWEDYLFGVAESDRNWDNLYHSNYITNYVLDNIGKVEEGVTYDRNEVKGQALVHRAMNYFLLTNIYGKQYKAASAGSDLAVPLILESDINKQYPRATVAEVYTRMLEDLDEAISLMKTEVSEFNNLPSLAAAYALRARYHLWMQNYDAAYTDAVKVLGMKSTMTDYNTCSFLMPGFPMYGLNGYDNVVLTSPETIYSRYVSENLMCTFTPKMYDIIDKENDLRYRFFIAAVPEYGYLEETCWNKNRHSGIDVAEVWLMKAESALRKSSPNVQEALDALNEVRRHRYDVATYQSFTDTQTLLTEILKERRREIIHTEFSFLDKKRLTADPATAEPMTRTYMGKSCTLPVDDPRWQLAIPLNVMELNPLLEQNER